MNLFGFDIKFNSKKNSFVKTKDCHIAQDKLKDAFNQRFDDFDTAIGRRFDDFKTIIEKNGR